MFTITKAAAADIRRSLEKHNFDDLPLRIAAQRAADGSFQYQMGFDEAGPGDTMISTAGIDVVIARDHKPLLNGCTLDFDVVDDGEACFIFLNPNDPSFVAPTMQDSPTVDKVDE